MLTIYSLGDPWYLGKVMDAIAMISGSKSGFVGASEVAALIGVFIIGFQAILKLQINIHHLLVCYIVYMGCFSVTTDVAIESVYSDKTVIQKDNVPYGPAVLGSVISQIGYGLTQKMEVAFSDIDEAKMTGGKTDGYLNPLYVLNNLANWSENGNLLNSLAQTQDGKYLAKNYMTYVADCTVKAVYLGPQWGGKTWNDVFNKPMGEDIQFNSELYGTEFISSSGTAEVLSCKEAYSKLMGQMDIAMTQVFANENEAKKMLYALGHCKTSAECHEAASSITPTEIAFNSFNQLGWSSQKMAQSYMMQGAYENLKKTGLAAGYKHYRDVNTANMLYQSIQQRNAQWTSEGSLFLNAMRPMMAFIEGFFYAISPFAAIIMLLGLFGLNIFFKYIMLLLWIQLWTPIMAIANLFIITSAKQALEPLTFTETTADDGGALSSYYYETIVQVCQDKIAVGSMMLAATPVLSLMIISGSVFAFTSLTNRIAGADHFNERAMSPDIVNPAAVMQMQSRFTGNEFGYSNNAKLQNTFAVGDALLTEKSNTLASLNAVNNSINTNMSKAYEENGIFSDSHSSDGVWKRMTQSGHGESLTQLTNKVKEYAHGSNITLTDTQAQDAALAVAGGTKALAALSARDGKGSAAVRAAASILKDGKTNGFGIKDEITSSVASAFSNTFKNDASFSKSGKEIEAVSEAAAKQRQLSQTYSEIEKYSKNVNSGASYNESEIISNVIKNHPQGELFYNGEFQKFINENLTDSEKKFLDATANALQTQDRASDVDIGSYAHQRYELEALKKISDGKAAIFMAKMMSSVGVGGNITPLEKTYETATTDNTEHATGPNQNDITRIRGKADSTKADSQSDAQKTTAEGNEMFGNELVNGNSKVMPDKTMNDVGKSNNGVSLDKNLLNKGAVKPVNVVDAIRPGALLSLLKQNAEKITYGSIQADYNTLYSKYQRISSSIDDQFKTYEGGNNQLLVNATRNLLIISKVSSDGILTQSPEEREALTEMYQNAKIAVAKLTVEAAKNNITLENGKAPTGEQAVNIAVNHLNSVIKNGVTGLTNDFSAAHNVLLSTR